MLLIVANEMFNTSPHARILDPCRQSRSPQASQNGIFPNGFESTASKWTSLHVDARAKQYMCAFGFALFAH
jgi:hypothetical protein